MTTGYGRGSGFLPRPPVGKHTSTAASRADDVRRREAVYREGLNAGLTAGCEFYAQLYPGGPPGWSVEPQEAEPARKPDK